MERPNIVFITVDQMRGDCLGVEGHPVVETPNLDCFAREGVRFSRAYSAVPSCIAARAAILTGLKQERHGRVGYQDGVPWNYECTLPGELAKHGYHTQGVGKMHFHPARALCGFHNVVLHDGYLHHNRLRQRHGEDDDYLPWLKAELGSSYADIIDHGLNCNSWVARPWPYAEQLHPTNWVVTQALDFLRRRDPTKPFFLWLSFVRPHAPLDPPGYYLEQYLQREIPLPPVGDWAEQEDPDRCGLIPDTDKGIINPEALRRARAAYYGLITHIDHQLGRFLEGLADYGELKRTLFVFTSDHGELLGDHHLFRKCLPYEGSARVPLIIRFPSDPDFAFAYRPGTVVDQPVELRDIMPTLLECAGIAVEKLALDGQSLLPLCRGETEKWREYLHGEHVYGERSHHYLTDGREKYVWFSQTGREQLFDLQKDPQELHDFSKDPAYRERLFSWRWRLITELRGREEGFVEGEELRVGKKSRPVLAVI